MFVLIAGFPFEIVTQGRFQEKDVTLTHEELRLMGGNSITVPVVGAVWISSLDCENNLLALGVLGACSCNVCVSALRCASGVHLPS